VTGREFTARIFCCFNENKKVPSWCHPNDEKRTNTCDILFLLQEKVQCLCILLFLTMMCDWDAHQREEITGVVPAISRSFRRVVSS
jgi:hypothetical protein